MTDLALSGPGGSFKATVTVPGDKSLSHRALMFAAMAEGDSIVTGLGPGEDITSTVAALECLVVTIIGEQVRSLAYPYGRFNDHVLNATRTAGYEAAFTTQPGFNRCDVDHYRIRRLDIFGTDTTAMLSRKIFFGSNDGSWQQTWRYYKSRVADKLGL